MKIIIKSTYSLHYYTLHLSYLHYSSVSLFELTRNAFNWSVFRSAIHQFASIETSVRLFSLFFFFILSSSSVFLLLLPLCRWKCSKNIYIERERAIQKNSTERKMRKSQSSIKEKEIQLKEKNEQWEAREKRERTWVLGYSDWNRFLWKDSSFTCPTWNLISASERCAIRCYFEQGH